MTEKNTDEEGWWPFLQLCSKVKTPERFAELFDLFLTIEERESIALRYVLVKALLEDNETQREIADRTHISISKITRGSNALKIVNNDFKEFVKTHIK